MMNRYMLSRAAAGAMLAGLAALTAGGPATAAEIGVMGASNPDLRGTPPAASQRLLVTGDAVFQNEEIVSGPNGLGFAMFPDQTTLTIAPNSRIVLDEYVYDPETATGGVAMTLTRGALRFVGGRITKSADATIRTPTATIGIRGGAAMIETEEDGAGRVTFVAGEYARVASGDETVVISRTGGVAEFGAIDSPSAAYAGVIDAATTAIIAARFSSAGNGGAAPDRIKGSAGGLAVDNSLAPNGVQAAAVSTSGLFLDEADPFESNLDGLELGDDVQTAIFMDGDMLDNLITDPIVDVGGEGVIRGQLIWNTSSDLDLHLILPDSAGEVDFGNRTIIFNNGAAIAELDADNLGTVVNIEPDLRVENIIVNGEVPEGDYVFFVDAFSTVGSGTDYDLNIAVEGRDTIEAPGRVGFGEASEGVTVSFE